MTGPPPRFGPLVLVLGLAPLAAGCGSPTATVSGTVTFQNRPVTGGSVILYCADKQIVRGIIGVDGRFEIPNVPHGQAVVTVQSHTPVPAGLQLRQKLPPSADGPIPPSGPADGRGPAPVVVPPRYGVPEESGLVLTVARDHVTYDIDLKP